MDPVQIVVRRAATAAEIDGAAHLLDGLAAGMAATRVFSWGLTD